jgi:hypothetical protein
LNIGTTTLTPTSAAAVGAGVVSGQRGSVCVSVGKKIEDMAVNQVFSA